MKIMLRAGLVFCLCLFLAGIAAGQDYYGAYSPYQGQDYSGYGAPGYDQSYSNYGQNSPYGYSPPYGYPNQSNVQGNRAPYGYDQYPGVPGYGRYDNTPLGAGSYGLQSASPRSNQPTLRTRLTPPLGRSNSPQVQETTRVVTPSAQRPQGNQRAEAIPASRDSEEGSLYNNEIYWNGRDSEVQESGPVANESQAAQPQPRRSTPPSAANSLRQAKPLSGADANHARTQPTRRNIVRQETKSAPTPPPPSASSSFKWGKDPAGVNSQSPQSQQSFKWGMDAKPSMVGLEPGRSASSQEKAQVSAQGPQPGASNSLSNNSKKFQWGKVD